MDRTTWHRDRVIGAGLASQSVVRKWEALPNTRCMGTDLRWKLLQEILSLSTRFKLA